MSHAKNNRSSVDTYRWKNLERFGISARRRSILWSEWIKQTSKLFRLNSDLRALRDTGLFVRDPFPEEKHSHGSHQEQNGTEGADYGSPGWKVHHQGEINAQRRY